MKTLPRVTDISAKHSIELLRPAVFMPVRAELESIPDDRMAITEAPLLLEMLGRNMSLRIGKAVNTIVVRHYTRQAEHIDRDYTPRRGQASFAGRVALVAFSGTADFMLHDGSTMHTSELEAGLAIYHDAAAVRWIAPPVTDEPLTLVTFAHDAKIAG